MPQFADRVKVTSTSTGTGAITLSSTAVSGYQAFPSSLDGETVGYVIESGSDWEIGTGTYTHSSLNLTRSLRSSSTGSLLSLAAGTHTVFLTPAFQDIQIVEAFSSTSDLPAASDNHGRVYHVHGEGALYFAHSGSWVKIANYSDITTYTHPNHSGEVTSTGDGATVIADGVVDEANLKVSNSPTDGYVLTARSGNTGGMTWEEASSGIALTDLSVTQNSASGSGALSYNNTTGSFTYTPPLLSGGGSSTTALSETTFSATANQTAFVVSGGITNAANITVFRNGVKLEEGISKDFTANAATNTVTLNSGAILNDVVEVLEYGQPGLALTDLSDTPSSLGTVGQTLLVNSGATGLEFGDAGSSVTVVSDLTALGAISSPSAGDLALVTDLNKIFVRKTAGWYLIATVTNQGPQSVSIAISGGGSGTSSAYTLADNGTTTSSVTGSADPDPEADDLTWSAAAGTSTAFSATLTDGGSAVNITTSADTSTVLATISQSSNVFTLTPSSSTTAPSGGTFAVTFSVTDGVNTSVDNSTTFTLSFASWSSPSQQAKLVGSDTSAGDYAGWASYISANGEYAIVGARLHSSPSQYAGAAYVYVRSGTSWSQQAKLQASDAATYNFFGEDVALDSDGDTAIVGASSEDTTYSDSGAAYIFVRSGTSWSQQAKLKPTDLAASDQAGYKVAISGDGNTAVVGAAYSDATYSDAGALYVYTRSGTSWTQQQKIQPSDIAASDTFAFDVALSGDGDYLIASSLYDDDTFSSSGSAYIFVRSGSTWSQQAKLVASDPGSNDSYGYSVDIDSDGNTAIVGSSSESSQGAAYIYTRSGTSWSQQQKIVSSDIASNDNFGMGVSITNDGDTVMVGARLDDDNSYTNSGSVYFFTRSGTSWSQVSKVTASDPSTGAFFGFSVSISDGNSAIAGATNKDAAYIFVKG
jgi:hypothetical protein